MQLVLVLNHFAKPPNQPGGNRHIDLFSRLDGWQVSILAADRNNMSDVRQVASPDHPLTYVRTIGGRTTAARVAAWVSYAVGAVVAGSRGARPDVIYASSPHLLAGLAGYVLARRWRVPWILEVRDVWPRILVEMGGMSESSFVYRVLRRLESFLYRRADYVVHLADGNRDYLAEEGVDPTQLSFIPNSVAPTEPALSREASRAKFDLRGVVVAYTGAHGRANGLELVVDAAAELADEFPDLEIVLVGDGSEKNALVERASRSKVGNVRFLDPIPKEEVPELLAGVDIGLHVLRDVPLFRHGVSPNKIMDYLAAGLPVVTNSPGEAGDVVLKAQAGEVVEPDNLVDGIRRMASLSSVEREALGQQGRRYVSDQRNPDLMARKLAAVLTTVVNSGSGTVEDACGNADDRRR